MNAIYPLAESTIFEKIIASLALVTLIFWMYPEVTFAANDTASGSLVFNIGPEVKTKTTQTKLLTYQDILQNDPLVTKVRLYLEASDSPLAPYAGEIVTLPQWQQALAISFVESDFCRVAAHNNCGSLGVSPSHKLWRKYDTAFDGFKDMTVVLEKPIYKQRYTTCKKKLGVYVVPGSKRWLQGCEQVSADLLTITAQAAQERLAIVNLEPVTAATNQIELINTIK